MLKRILTTSVLATALVTTPALAWEQRYTIVNNTRDIYFYITKVTIAPPGETVDVGPVGPQQSAKFNLGEGPSCTVSVTISQQYGPQIRAQNLFNACSQSTITISISPAGQPVFSYN